MANACGVLLCFLLFCLPVVFYYIGTKWSLILCGVVVAVLFGGFIRFKYGKKIYDSLYCQKCCEPEPEEIVVMEASDGKFPCYLCHTRVPIDLWDSGEHRRECATTHADKLSIMTKYIQKICPKCDQIMRFWPQEGELFYCNNNRLCQTSEGRTIENTGLIRLNCFQCNIDFCLPCIRAELAINSNQTEDTDILDTNPNDSEPTPWIPSAPSEEEYNPSAPENGSLNPPSYDEAIVLTAP